MQRSFLVNLIKFVYKNLHQKCNELWSRVLAYKSKLYKENEVHSNANIFKNMCQDTKDRVNIGVVWAHCKDEQKNAPVVVVQIIVKNKKKKT